MATVQRYDAGEVRGFERTPQGGLRVAGAVARTGVLLYQTEDGRTVREYVPPATLFAADSLASLRGAPITDLHPVDDAGKPVLVTAATWKKYSVGTLGDTARADGALLVADLLVQDAGEVALVEAQARRELSCGYEAEIDATPGVSPAGEHYDQAQTRRVYNHVALGPLGWGRAGPDVALRMDAAGHALPTAAPTAATRLDTAKETPSMKTVLKIAGKEFALRADALEGDAAAAQGAIDAGAGASAAISAQLEATTQALAGAMGELAKLKAKLAAEEAAEGAAAPTVTEDTVPEAVLDAALAKREALRADARVVLGAEVKLDGLRPAEIRAKVLAHLAPEVKLDGLKPEAVEGMYGVAVASAKRAAAGKGEPRNDALDAARRAAEGRTDGAGEPGTEDAMEKAREQQRADARKRAM